jgi:hypothetical protein
MPSEQLFGQMEALSWAIPIENFQDQIETLFRVNIDNKLFSNARGQRD